MEHLTHLPIGQSWSAEATGHWSEQQLYQQQDLMDTGAARHQQEKPGKNTQILQIFILQQLCILYFQGVQYFIIPVQAVPSSGPRSYTEDAGTLLTAHPPSLYQGQGIFLQTACKKFMHNKLTCDQTCLKLIWQHAKVLHVGNDGQCGVLSFDLHNPTLEL